jgi:Spx/MgsR family transcriptional regulator
MVTIYGIKNCDTMKKARAWLAANGVDYVFHDYREAGIDAATLKRWARAVGWDKLLNKAGTTFRGLPPEKKAVSSEAGAMALMLEAPTLIKRPVLDRDGDILVGFKPDLYAEAFAPG